MCFSKKSQIPGIFQDVILAHNTTWGYVGNTAVTRLYITVVSYKEFDSSDVMCMNQGFHSLLAAHLIFYEFLCVFLFQ